MNERELHADESHDLPDDEFASRLAAMHEALVDRANGCDADVDGESADSGLVRAKNALELLERMRRLPPRNEHKASKDGDRNAGTVIFAPHLVDDSTEAADETPRLTHIGNYEILEEIARGGMGIVFRARHESLDRVVALKMIRAGPFAQAEERQRFRVEAEAAAQLDHPGIVPVYDVGEYCGQPYFTMGFVDGESLSKRIGREPLEPRTAAELTRQVAEAVDHAHRNGVVHRDIKPLNVLIDPDGRPRITDFGLARRTESDSDLTGTGQVLGTPSYMAPEQASGKSDSDGRLADVYSIGATLYCTLTGRPPFQAANAIDTLRLVIEQDPLSPRQLNPTIPVELATICLKCLHKEPHRRYATAADLAADLQRFLNGEPIHARPVGRLKRAVKWGRRRPLVATLTGVSAIALIALIVGGIWYQARLSTSLAETEQERQNVSESQQDTVDLLYESLTSEAEFLNQVRPVGYGTRVWRLLDQARRLKTRKADQHQILQRAINALGHPAASEPVVFEALGAKVLGADVTADGRFLLAGLDNGEIVVMDRASRAEFQRLDAGSEPVMRIRILNSSRFMSHGPFGRALSFWSRGPSDQWELEQRHDFSNTDGFFHVLPNTNGQFVAGWTPLPADEVTQAKWDSTRNVPETIAASHSTQPHFFLKQIGGFLQSKPSEDSQPVLLSDVPFSTTMALADHFLVVGHTIESPWTTSMLIVNLHTGQIEREITTDCGTLATVAVTRDARFVACSGHLGVQIFDRESGTELAKVEDEGSCFLISMVGTDGDVYFNNIAGELVWYSPSQDQTVARFRHQPDEGVPRFSSAGQQLIWSGTNDARVADLHGSELRQITAHADRVASLCFSPDGQLIASAGDEQWIRLWDRKTGELLYELPGHGVTFDPAGRWLVTIDGNTLTFWNIAQATPAGAMDLGSYRAEFQFNATGTLLAVTQGDGRDLSVWKVGHAADATRLVTTEPVLKLDGPIWYLLWSPSRNRLLYVRLVEDRSRIHLHDFDAPQNSGVVKETPEVFIETLAFVGPDRLAIIDENVVEIWDLHTRKRICVGSQVTRFPVGVSPDARFVVGRNRILRADNLEDAVELPIWNKAGWSVAWSPDGRTLALGFDGGRLDLWNLEAVNERLATLELEFPASNFRDLPTLESVTSLIELCRQSHSIDDPSIWQSRYDAAIASASGDAPLPESFRTETDWLVNHFVQSAALFQSDARTMPAERILRLARLSAAVKRHGAHDLSEGILLGVIRVAEALRDADVDVQVALSSAHHELGDLYCFQLVERLQDALDEYRTEAALIERALNSPGPSTVAIPDYRLFWMNHNYALALAKSGDRATAIEPMQLSLAISRSNPSVAPDHMLQRSYGALIDWLKAENRPEEAEAVLEQAREAGVLNQPRSTPE